jgi:hypothetical protein
VRPAAAEPGLVLDRVQAPGDAGGRRERHDARGGQGREADDVVGREHRVVGVGCGGPLEGDRALHVERRGGSSDRADGEQAARSLLLGAQRGDAVGVVAQVEVLRAVVAHLPGPLVNAAGAQRQATERGRVGAAERQRGRGAVGLLDAQRAGAGRARAAEGDAAEDDVGAGGDQVAARDRPVGGADATEADERGLSAGDVDEVVRVGLAGVEVAGVAADVGGPVCRRPACSGCRDSWRWCPWRSRRRTRAGRCSRRRRGRS